MLEEFNFPANNIIILSLLMAMYFCCSCINKIHHIVCITAFTCNYSFLNPIFMLPVNKRLFLDISAVVIFCFLAKGDAIYI